MPVVIGGHNLSPLVEIGLTDLPKSVAHPAHPGTTGLLSICTIVGSDEQIRTKDHPFITFLGVFDPPSPFCLFALNTENRQKFGVQ